MNINRIKKEFETMEDSISLIDNNILHWNYILKGPINSPYHNGIFHLDIYFPNKY